MGAVLVAALLFGGATLNNNYQEQQRLAVAQATAAAQATVMAQATAPAVVAAPAGPIAASTAEEILIPAGEFQMGCDSNNSAESCGSDEQPLHTVRLDAYAIDKYEVTNGRYQSCVDAGGCTPPQKISSYTHDPYYGDPDYADYPVGE